jgi:hypothetical protein
MPHTITLPHELAAVTGELTANPTSWQVRRFAWAVAAAVPFEATWPLRLRRMCLAMRVGCDGRLLAMVLTGFALPLHRRLALLLRACCAILVGTWRTWALGTEARLSNPRVHAWTFGPSPTERDFAADLSGLLSQHGPVLSPGDPRLPPHAVPEPATPTSPAPASPARPPRGTWVQRR